MSTHKEESAPAPQPMTEGSAPARPEVAETHHTPGGVLPPPVLGAHSCAGKMNAPLLMTDSEGLRRAVRSRFADLTTEQLRARLRAHGEALWDRREGAGR